MLATEGEPAYGIYYPTGFFSSFRSLQTFSIIYPNEKVSKSLITSYTTKQEPCINKASNRLAISIVCNDRSAQADLRYERLSYVAAFLHHGYKLLANIAEVPSVQLKLIEVSPQVTQTGFDLRVDIKENNGVYRLVYFLPYIGVSKSDRWINLAEKMYHELVHFAMWEKSRYTHTVLANEFIAHFISKMIPLELIYPTLLTRMQLKPPRFDNPTQRYGVLIEHLASLASDPVLDEDHPAELVEDYNEVVDIAKGTFWLLRLKASASCVDFEAFLIETVDELWRNRKTPALVMQQAYMSLESEMLFGVQPCTLDQKTEVTGEHFPNVTFTFN